MAAFFNDDLDEKEPWEHELDAPRNTEFDPDKAEKYIAWSGWIWLIGSVIADFSAIYAAVTIGNNSIVVIILVLSLVQSAIAIPAAVVLMRQRKSWARIVIMVLSLLQFGGIYQAFQMQAWPTLILSLVMSAPYTLMIDKNVKALCKARSD